MGIYGYVWVITPLTQDIQDKNEDVPLMESTRGIQDVVPENICNTSKGLFQTPTQEREDTCESQEIINTCMEFLKQAKYLKIS